MPSSANILIIDDEANQVTSLSLILRGGGYTVTGARTAYEALELLQAHEFNLAILDISLPDMKGTDLLERIRASQPDLPVLMLTGNASLDSAIQALRQGARDYMLKPVDPEYILVRVKDILEENRQPRRRREIARMIQDLMSELTLIDMDAASPAREPQTLPPTDVNRFIRVGGLSLDLHARHCFLNGRYVTIPSSTFDYLIVLARHSPEPVSFETLVLEAQGYKVTRIEASEMARWQMHELRKALEANAGQPGIIITVRNVGYRLVA